MSYYRRKETTHKPLNSARTLYARGRKSYFAISATQQMIAVHRLSSAKGDPTQTWAFWLVQHPELIDLFDGHGWDLYALAELIAELE